MHHKHQSEVISFIKSGLLISAPLTVLVVLFTYKDILYLRFFSGFVENFSLESAAFQQFLANGFSYKLQTSLATNSPNILAILAVLVTSYMGFYSFKRIYSKLDTNQNYINTTKQPMNKILLSNITFRSFAFTIPLIFWVAYILILFPKLALLPLKFIASGNIALFGTVFFAVTLLLVAITHSGLLITRLSARYLRIE
jgi:hypothetical protein